VAPDWSSRSSAVGSSLPDAGCCGSRGSAGFASAVPVEPVCVSAALVPPAGLALVGVDFGGVASPGVALLGGVALVGCGVARADLLAALLGVVLAETALAGVVPDGIADLPFGRALAGVLVPALPPARLSDVSAAFAGLLSVTWRDPARRQRLWMGSRASSHLIESS